MNKIVPTYTNKKIRHGCNVTTFYVSLINPFILTNYSFENYKRSFLSKPNQKIYVKQSYMILTWFYYLNFVTKKKNGPRLKGLQFSILPKFKRKFTMTKAPIAHKTNSKEQILFTFFKFKMSVSIYDFKTLDQFVFYKSFNSVLLLILLSKNTLALSETNLLFLQRKKVSLTFIDPFFCTYGI